MAAREKKLQKIQRTFTAKQNEFIESGADRVMYSGAVGAGKSFGICAKGFLMNISMPGNKGLLTRKAFSTLKSSTLETLLRGDPDTEPILPGDWIVDHNKSEHRIVHKTLVPGDYSEIWYEGLDSKGPEEYPTKIGSTQFGWIGVDELTEISRRDFEFLESRLRHPVPMRQIFGATNPSGPQHWAYQMFFKEKAGRVITATPYDNPHLDEDYINRLEERYTGMMRDRLLKGEWVAAEGLVYKNFDPHGMVVSSDHVRLQPKRFKKMVVGADSGYTNPRAAVVAGVDSHGYVYVIDEFYRTRTGISELIGWLREKGYSPNMIYHDPSEPEEIEELKRAGFRATGATNDVIPGITKLSGKLQKDSRGRNKLLIADGCKNLKQEFQSYRYPDDKGDERNRKEKPVKENDHLMDSLRYLVMGIETSGGGSGREPAYSF
jgi:PBSX family phage terminase large subunit